MKLELLAKEMRERALLLESDSDLTAKDLNGINLEKAKQRQLQKVEELKKLYFNAGRWSAGARDNVARESFYKINKIDK
jgi:hypothetical protein